MEVNEDEDDDRDFFECNFKVTGTIGRGEFADVVKVKKRDDGKLYAVKKSRSAFTGYKDRIVKLEEVEIMWKVSSSAHCVHLYNAWEQHGFLYMQMELCSSGTLYSYLDNPHIVLPIDEFKLWFILANVAQVDYFDVVFFLTQLNRDWRIYIN